MKYVIQWIVLVALQVLLFKDFVFFSTSFCFAYVAAFLLVPMQMSTVSVMALAFATGLAVDVFYDTLGIHAAASALVAFLRAPLQAALTPAGGYEPYMEASIPSMGLQWYLLYLSPLVLIHALACFWIEYALPTAFLDALVKALATVPFTVLVVVLVQNLFVPGVAASR